LYSVIFFLLRWQKFKLFWFFVLALCVGKNQMCLNVRLAFQHGIQRFAAMRRAGVLPGNVLLESRISRFRNLSTEDEFPAWRIAVVGRSAFIFQCCLS
jgi:hypothetical protein